MVLLTVYIKILNCVVYFINCSEAKYNGYHIRPLCNFCEIGEKEKETGITHLIGFS